MALPRESQTIDLFIANLRLHVLHLGHIHDTNRRDRGRRTLAHLLDSGRRERAAGTLR